MRRVYVTVTRRVQKGASQDEYRGSVVVLDWDERRVVAQHWVEGAPGRGSSTGCRGMAIHEGRLAVAVAPNVVQCRNLDSLAVEDEFEVPGVADVHQVQSRDGLLWVVNTHLNELVVLRGREVLERRSAMTPDVQRYVFTWRYGDPACIDKLHFNSIGWSPGGHEMHVYSDANMIYDATLRRPAWLGQPLAKPHDVVFASPDEVLVNSSTDHRTFLLHLSNSNYRELYHAEAQARLAGPTYAAAGWTRGLDVRGTRAFIGVSPAAVVEVDVHAARVVSEVRISDNLQETPYGVLLDPRDWK
jgi:hypothetical protein